MAYDVDGCLARLAKIEEEKRPWLPLLEAVAKTFYTRKQGFQGEVAPGAFLQEDIFSNTGQYAAYLMASVFLSYLWPDAARTFRLKPVRRLRDVPGIDEYFRYVTEEVQAAMDNPRAGLLPALMEHFHEKGVFGISGLGVFEGPKDDKTLPVVFDAWGIKTMWCSENAQGFVDTIFYKRKLTIRQIMKEYAGNEDKIHSDIREKAKNPANYEEKVEVLYVLEPKQAVEGAADDSYAAMEFASIHIDAERKFVMRESGYHEQPVFVSRFFKLTGEVMGRSPAMTVLPAAINLNALDEGVIRATEKQLDPPLALLDDARLGGGVVDTSAGALNVFNSTGRLGADKPIFPLFTVGEMQSAKDLKEQLREEVMQGFFLDRLLDLNNQTQMTAFETSVRARMRGDALGSIFSREEMETLTPMIGRSFNILWRSGRLGVVETGIGAMLRKLWAKIAGSKEIQVPQAVIDAAKAGLDIYEVEYISPAKRFQQSEKLQGIFTGADAIAALEAVLPGISDNLNADRTAENIWRYAGAPVDCLNTKGEREDIRAKKIQRQQTADALEVAKGGSEAARNMAQARTSMGTAAQGAK